MKKTMKPAGHRGHQCTALRIVLLLSMSISAVSPSPVACQVGEFLTDDNICCQRCPAGSKLAGDCPSPLHKTNCTDCPDGQYMDKVNYARNCIGCKSCKVQFEIEVSPCTRKKNTVCRCMDGYYKDSIDSVTYECSRCSTCGNNERVAKNCSPEGNTVCRCRDDYYKVKNKCLPCTNCTTGECSKECPSGTKGQDKDTSDPHPFLVNVIAGAAVAVALTLVLVVVVTHFVTKRQTKKKLLSSQEYKESPKIYEELTTHFEEPLVNSLNSAPLHDVISQEPLNLPDCIPLEIKIPDVIYTLLDLVPVLRVKQLVRSLGVGETVIERAELDHRSSREAHYQMLRAWAEQGGHTSRGGGGQGGVLHLPLLHQLLDKLRLMHLEQTAQELETKYNLL